MTSDILILCSSDSRRDPRVIRQRVELEKNYSVKVLGSDFLGDSFSKQQHAGRSWRLSQFKLMMIGFFCPRLGAPKAYPIAKALWAPIFEQRPTVIVCNDLELLGCALMHKKQFGTKVIFDAHEYYPGQTSSVVQRLIHGRLRTELCRRIDSEVDFSITVCESIRNLYETNFGVKRMEIIWNCSKFLEIEPTQLEQNRPIRFVHHGLASPSREIENMIKVFECLGPEYELNLILVGGKYKYRQKIIDLAESLDNVHLVPPVDFEEIVPMLSNYDMGLFLLPSNTINHRFALPNKFFEFVQARLGVIIWPSEEMKKVIHRFEFGLVTNKADVLSVVAAIKSLSREEVFELKKASARASVELSSEREWRKLSEIVNSLN